MENKAILEQRKVGASAIRERLLQMAQERGVTIDAAIWLPDVEDPSAPSDTFKLLITHGQKREEAAFTGDELAAYPGQGTEARAVKRLEEALTILKTEHGPEVYRYIR